MFDKISHGCCSKVFDTEKSEVKVLTDTTTSTLNIAKSEEVHVFDRSSHINKSESVSTFETRQSVDDNSFITTASVSIPDPPIRVADEENSTTAIDKVINGNFCENDSLLQSSCETLQTEVTAAAFDNATEGNALNNVAREFENSPLGDKIGYQIPFASQGFVMSNAIGRFVGIAYPIVGTIQKILWLHYDFDLHKCNWVATGQHDSLLLTAKRQKDCHIYIQSIAIMQEILAYQFVVIWTSGSTRGRNLRFLQVELNWVLNTVMVI